MPAPYSMDLRWKALTAYLAGEGSQSAIAARFSMSVSSLKRYLRRLKQTGDPRPNYDSVGRPRAVNDQASERRLLQ